jgi:hypothetical protein
MTCVPQPPPTDLFDTGLDDAVPVGVQTRGKHWSIDSSIALVNSARIPDTAPIRPQIQQLRQSGYSLQYKPNERCKESTPYRPEGQSNHMRSFDKTRHLSPTEAHADPPRAWTQTPGWTNSTRTSSFSSIVFTGSARSAIAPPPLSHPQFNPTQRPTAPRTRSSSLSDSVYSISSEDSTDFPPPISSMSVHRTAPGKWSMRFIASSDSASHQ